MTAAPQQLGNYRVLDVLGSGGMGVVYRATHNTSGRMAAVKTVAAITESTLESLRREIQMLCELRHPGVVGILDHGVTEQLPWYAMELLRGRTLRDDFAAWYPTSLRLDATTRDLGARWHGREEMDAVALAADALPAFELVELARISALFHKICSALSYVHGQGIIHRDLSPSNVFLIDEDEPVLFDFGLAAQFRTSSGRDVLEVGGLLRGTVHYMAPEQARGEIVDARADVYSLGCMLYEAVAGRPPFVADSALSVLMRHLEDSPLPPSTYRPALPHQLDDLVMHMLQKRPRDRIGYAEDVAARLAQLAPSPAGAGSAALGVPLRPRAYVYRAGLAGRTELLDQLDSLLLRFTGGPGACAVLIGESGVGKTRLAGELATLARNRDLRVITGECEPLGLGARADDLRAAPLHPLRPLLRVIADRCRRGGSSEAERLLGPSGGLLAAYEPALAGLVVVVEDRVDPATARYRVLAVMRDVIRALIHDEPFLLVLDDLQWADELTLALLASFGHDLQGLLLLGTVRAEEMTPELDALLRSLGAMRVAVPRLDQQAVGSMVRDMLAIEDEAPILTQLIAQRSEGNPWLAAEYVRTAVEEGALQRDLGGSWRLRDTSDFSTYRLPTPGSVQTLVHRRMQALSPAARQLALAAAVLGRVCDAGTLAVLTGSDPEHVRAALVELIQRQVLHELGNGELRFAHDRLREHAYGELAQTDRRALHRRAALALEARMGDGPDLSLRFSELALHWEIAGDLSSAAGYLERGAEHALSTAAFGDAQSLLRRLRELPLVVDSARSARWDRWLGEACFALGDLATSARYSMQSLDQLGQSLPSSMAGWSATISLGIARQAWSRVVRSRRLPGWLRRRSDADPDPSLVDAALASARMTSYYFFNNDSLGVLGASLQAINLAERADQRVPVAEIYSQLGYVAQLAKLRPVSRGYFAKARATAKTTRDSSGLAWAYFGEAASTLCTAEWLQARLAASKGMVIAESLRNPQDIEVAQTLLGHCEFVAGDYPAAMVAARALYTSAHQRANRQHEAWGLYTQARVALYRGDLDQAIADFELALQLLVGVSDQASQILCGGMLACALARAGRSAPARIAADDATARIDGRTPPVFTISEGFVCTAEAYLELWRRGDPSVQPAARLAVRNLARLARLLPIASSAAATLMGMVQLRSGQPARARRSLRRGLAIAESFALPYDQAVAHHGLALAVDNGARLRHHAAARQLFARLGCRWHLQHLYADVGPVGGELASPGGSRD